MRACVCMYVHINTWLYIGKPWEGLRLASWADSWPLAHTLSHPSGASVGSDISWMFGLQDESGIVVFVGCREALKAP